MPSTRGPREHREGESARFVPFAAYRFRRQEVHTPNGDVGRVKNVLLGDDGRHYAIIDFGPNLGTHQAPISGIAYENGRFVLNESDVLGLPAFVEGQDGLRALDPEAAISIPGYRHQATDDATILVQSASPQVTVQRPALQINWEQAPPQVTVHQPTPHVNVRQMQPVIIVRQPPPRVIVEIDQPEIIVRMPEPQVDVAIAEPDVQVSMPKPHVEVLQTEQPQVRVTGGEPVVSLAPRPAADIAIERAQPRVRFERIGEPQVSIREVNGGPRILFEEISREEALRMETETENQVKTFSAGQLHGMKIFSREGNEIGTIHRVVIDSGRPALVLETGGFLGLAKRKIAFPVGNFDIRGDRLILRNFNAAEVAEMETREEDLAKLLPTTEDRKVQIGLAH